MDACKCCGAPTRPFGQVDAARCCEDRGGAPVFAATGRLITYRRCVACGFVGTGDFDHLSDAELAAEIYNADYIRADPAFADSRPAYFARVVADWLPDVGRVGEALDYGGGQGAFAAAMQERGHRFANWDPHFHAAPRPTGRFGLVTAFEVVEHSRDPVGTFRDAAACLQPDGVLVFTTLLVPPEAGPEWWYVAPRNGHVSLHTAASLRACAARCGLRLLSVSEGLHLFLPPHLSPLARHMVHAKAAEALYNASLRGPAELWHTAREVARAGRLRDAANPRHAARALLRGNAEGTPRPDWRGLIARHAAGARRVPARQAAPAARQ
ncbi:class I SAM-dependent methyltransferase [Falsiroseomonas oryzae]|uniref:class I SAM-dependent methyltransferase n=1 Tax=Falsiroseomonas oryzae TaxID=2766473 RepID=UPI0022EB7421|nr:class I SAM-dependent methyltransferase [Roseomonas sp. MO-31]